MMDLKKYLDMIKNNNENVTNISLNSRKEYAEYLREISRRIENEDLSIEATIIMLAKMKEITDKELDIQRRCKSTYID